MVVLTKMAEQNQIFHITRRVSNIFSVFFLHSFGVTKKKFQDGGWNEKTRWFRPLAGWQIFNE
jgi:hypothetical protein